MTNVLNPSHRPGSVTLKLNGSTVESAAATVTELLAEQGLDPSRPGIAVALNDTVIPRSDWQNSPIGDGDRVEVITAMQGG